MDDLRTTAARPLVVDVARSAGARDVSVEWGPVAELLMSLSAFLSPEIQATFETGAGPFDDLRARMTPELRTALAAFGERGAVAGAMLAFAWHAGLLADVDAFLAEVERAPILELRIALLGGHWPGLRELVPDDVLEAAARGDAAAGRRLVESVPEAGEGDDEADEREALGAILALGVEQTRAAVLELLSRWRGEVFAEREAEAARALPIDVEAKRALQRSVTRERLIEVATNGLEFTPQPWTRRVILIPHIAMRPWNVMNAWDDTQIICYPAADESLGVDTTAPPPRLVRLHKALGDERRLRMLKRLARGTATLQELADAAGLAKSTAHHHTVILRSAGLITVTLEDTSRYTLRADAVTDGGPSLGAYLEGRATR